MRRNCLGVLRGMQAAQGSANYNAQGSVQPYAEEGCWNLVRHDVMEFNAWIKMADSTLEGGDIIGCET